MGLLGSSLGPSAVGTAYLFLYHFLGAPHGHIRGSRFVRGGMAQLADALSREAISRGVEIRCEVEVKEITLEGDRAVGVALKDGTQYWARSVLSNASPRHTFFELVGANLLEVRFVRELKNIRYRGSTARVILGLCDFPHFRATVHRQSDIMEGTLLSGHTVICPSLEYLERAHDEAKYGQLPGNPFLEIVLPTILDAAPGPKGQHLMLINVQYVPYSLREGSWEVERARLGAQVVELLETYAPGFQDLVQHCMVLTPPDLEERFGLPGGCLYHGEMALDQLLFMRPVPGYANYRTPVQNLYLCGAGTHPGGGVTGAPGFNAAREVIKALGKR
jgi:phytoene dehydrogenase-like protein